ncbi:MULTISPECIES: ThiF family adenylyltransferase [unclassified Streptomyces]|uniref:HesA/MoeB/ThiF family protein n=1 Tax=unclassified Streptomyces TaxID=2593676 RepID=UPI001F2509A5|nr:MULTISPECIES: ThiF family adenylyltransferase [unclassified Streptomyces]WKX18927.1 ThiF family adenylyltransferase [Streptomyces sp. HUAS CX7]
MTVHAMRLPRIKPEHRAYRTVDGHVRIGSVVHGIGAEVRDADGWVWTLVQAMDGTRSATDVVAEVSRRHPELRLPAPDIAQAMTDLTDAGYVEDAGAEPPAELSERERERYSRSMTLLRWMDLRPRSSAWEPQLLLRRARVLLVGVGGTGSAAARDLVASGVGRLHCVEPDVVELSNLNRQTLFHESDLGKPKLDAALTALRALNPDTEVTGERREVRGPADLEELLTGAGSRSRSRSRSSGTNGRRSPDSPVRAPGYDALLLAADRPAEIRRWANQICLSTGTPWAEAGYRGPLVSVGVFTPGRGACWQCLRDAEVERRDLRLGPGQDEDVASPRMPWNPANAVTAGLSGGLLAHAALMLLCGVPPVDPGCRFGLNLMLPGDPVLQRAQRRPDCPACRRTEPDPVTGPVPDPVWEPVSDPVPDPLPAARAGSGDRDPS